MLVKQHFLKNVFAPKWTFMTFPLQVGFYRRCSFRFTFNISDTKWVSLQKNVWKFAKIDHKVIFIAKNKSMDINECFIPPSFQNKQTNLQIQFMKQKHDHPPFHFSQKMAGECFINDKPKLNLIITPHISGYYYYYSVHFSVTVLVACCESLLQ